MVISGIIKYEDHFAILSFMAHNLTKESEKTFITEFFRATYDKPSVVSTHCAEHPNTLTGGGMKQYRVTIFRGYPHGTT
jgi:hypothetical protein